MIIKIIQATTELIGNKKEKLAIFNTPTNNAVIEIVTVPSLCIVII
jgi:hypothetical protein